MDRKKEFVRLALTAGANRRELCRRFGVSAPLAYPLMSRYLAEGEAGLEERSRTRGRFRTDEVGLETARRSPSRESGDAARQSSRWTRSRRSWRS